MTLSEKNCSETMNNKEIKPVMVGCTVMVVKNGKVLLGERSDGCETAKNLYAFPGGRMDFGETPKACAVRELFEETGIKVNENNISFVRYVNEFFPESNKHYVSLNFMVINPDGEPDLKEKDKCKGWEWFDPFNLPLNIYPPVEETVRFNKYTIMELK